LEERGIMKKALKTIFIIMASLLMITLLSGCREDLESTYEVPEFIYVPKFLTIPIPEEMTEVRNLVYVGDRVYFTSFMVADWESFATETKVFTMQIDGSGMAELVNYSAGLPNKEVLSNITIESLHVDKDGYLWVHESGRIFQFSLPEDFDEESSDKWQYYEDLGSVNNIRQLDSTGMEVLSLDIESIIGNAEWYILKSFVIDKMSNIYIAAQVDNRAELYVLNSDRNLLFKLNIHDRSEQLISLPDGSIALIESADTNGELEYTLRFIDFDAKTWGNSVALPEPAFRIFPGGEEFALIFHDSMNLYGFDFDSEESTTLLSWLNSGILADNISNVVFLTDGRIILTSTTHDIPGTSTTFELVILTRTPFIELEDRTILTLATFSPGQNLRSAILDFNRINSRYRIHVNDYAEFSTDDDWSAGLIRLSTEIIAGRVPDIIDVSNLPFKQYAARGLFVNLYDLIDADPELNREDFLERVLYAAEVDGNLYQIFPSFIINTLVGHPSVVGENTSWNIDEFKAVLDNNPRADAPLGRMMTRMQFLRTTVMLGIDNYIDWATGTAHFDTGEFAKLLELANRFPIEWDWSADRGGDLVAAGRTIMGEMYFVQLQQMQRTKADYGGDIVFKGFPVQHGVGNSMSAQSGLAITTACVDKNGAWEFIRTLLTTEWQLENTWGFPSNQAAFDIQVARAMTEDVEEDTFHGTIIFQPLTQTDIDQVLTLINSVSSIAHWDEALINIIMEGAEDFFNGRGSAQDAARIIQNRASNYVSEQSR
jgi:ABC-type glycerol-3-phosphate transport system substrate-binding protein